MSTHAQLSPSSSKRWGGKKGCPASVKRSAGIAGKPNPASRKGTAKHFVSAICLEKRLAPASFLGKLILFVSELDEPEKERECFAEEVNVDAVLVNAEFPIDQEFVDHCDIYVNYVREYVALNGGELFVEQRLSIEHITAEKDATGTTDALVIRPKVLTVIDAKFGVGKVNAYEGSEPNSQLAMYADAALVEHEMFFDFEWVCMVIVQPALNHVSEFSMSVADLKAYIQTIREAAEVTRSDDAPFNPSSDNCFFCTARTVCEAREQFVLNAVLGDFEDLSAAQPRVVDQHELGDLYAITGLVREWCDDIEDKVKAALDNGQVVRRADGLRYKLVNGKLGNRKWSDEAAVIEQLREMRLKDHQIFHQSLISPTDAEKLAKVRKTRGKAAAAQAEAESEKALIGPVRWARLQEFIQRADGKPEVALETDKRPEITQIDDDFEVLPVQISTPVSQDPVMAEPIESDLF